MRRFLTIFILIILCFLFQSAVFGLGGVTGAAPNLILILTMSFGLMRGRKEGMLTGFFSGFLMDVFYGTLIGPYMLLYLFIGYVNGSFHKNYTTDSMMLPVVLSAADELVFNAAVYVTTFLLRNRVHFGFYLVHVFLPQIFYTVLLTAVIYRLFVLINRHLKKKAKKK